MAYNLAALIAAYPSPVPHQPVSASNPQLGDFLRYGSSIELAEMICAGEIQDPYLTLALVALPPTVLLLVLHQRLAAGLDSYTVRGNFTIGEEDGNAPEAD